jgi:general stress protein 26
MEEINYNILKDKAVQFLGAQKFLVLATSSDDRVTARTMGYVNKGLTIYFQTERNSLKIEQIETNPNVALCGANVQIEGIAKIRNHPFDPSNKEFIELFKKKYTLAFNTYSHLKNEIVIEVEARLITFWKYIDDKPFREFLYIKETKAEREYYDISQ